VIISLCDFLNGGFLLFLFFVLFVLNLVLYTLILANILTENSRLEPDLNYFMVLIDGGKPLLPELTEIFNHVFQELVTAYAFTVSNYRDELFGPCHRDIHPSELT